MPFHNRLSADFRSLCRVSIAKAGGFFMVPREELLRMAREAALHAHCPYSHFRVGTALVAGGSIYTGVNVEISSYGLTLCAERSALASAISNGERSVTQV